jgi:hypothetical protein
MKTNIENYRISFYNPFLIFFLSILACLFVLSVERLIGMEWDFHPDANTYIVYSSGTIDSFSIQNYFGGFFYILVDMMNSQIWLIITFNIFIYSITNVALANFFKKNAGLHKKQIWILFLLVIFNPYRTHLSVQVLKDTLIIFSLVYFFTAHRIYSWIFLLVAYSVSVRAVIYLTALLNKKNLIILIIPMVIFLLIQPEDFLPRVLSATDQVDMTFRGFDKVPNFFEFGLLGAIIRAIVWPFLFLTGLFFLISPALLYLPVAVGSIFLQFWSFKQYGRPALYLQVYLAMGILAFMVSGFTSFIRYTLPLLTILPILVIQKNNKQRKLYSNKEN